MRVSPVRGSFITDALARALRSTWWLLVQRLQLAQQVAETAPPASRLAPVESEAEVLETSIHMFWARAYRGPELGTDLLGGERDLRCLRHRRRRRRRSHREGVSLRIRTRAGDIGAAASKPR